MRFQKKVLDNGLTVLFEKRDVPVATVMLAVKYGSAYDNVNEKGMAHFIEHLCFKGTGKRTAKEIVDEIEKIGGELNAFTSDEFTAYFSKLPSAHLGVAMDVIFDAFFNASFPEKEIGREANVVAEEIKMYRDNPRAHSFNKIRENLYEEPFSIFACGKSDVVKSMKRDQLKKRHRDVYAPNNSILCVVGNNDFDDIVEMAKKMSVDRKGIKKEMPLIRKKIAKSSESRIGIEQANLVIGFHFPDNNKKTSYVAEVFSAILGSGMSSKLFTEVREKRGLVYGIKTDLDKGKDFGYIEIWAGTDSQKVEEVLRVSLEEFRKLGSISEEELREAKIQVVGNRDVASEGSMETAISLVSEEVYGYAEDYYKYKENIDKVSLKDIKDFSEIAEYSVFSLVPE